MFDVHKIKPVHGWREFFGEVGIIVLGVLIALSFEQIVEIAHWHCKVSEATELLGDSVTAQAIPAIEQQIVSPCITQQIDTLEQRLLAPGPYQPVTLVNESKFIPFVIRAPSRPWTDTVWATITSERVSTHFDCRLRSILDRYYALLNQNHDTARQIDQISSRLNALSLPIDKSPDTTTRLLQDIEEYRAKQAFLTLGASQSLGYAGYLRMLPTKHEIDEIVYKKSGTIAFCRQKHLILAPPQIENNQGRECEVGAWVLEPVAQMNATMRDRTRRRPGAVLLTNSGETRHQRPQAHVTRG